MNLRAAASFVAGAIGGIVSAGLDHFCTYVVLDGYTGRQIGCLQYGWGLAPYLGAVSLMLATAGLAALLIQPKEETPRYDMNLPLPPEDDTLSFGDALGLLRTGAWEMAVGPGAAWIQQGTIGSGSPSKNVYPEAATRLITSGAVRKDRAERPWDIYRAA